MISLSGGICDGVGQAPETVSQESPRPTATLELAELELLWDRYSQLEEEVEALKYEAEHLGQQEAWVREMTVFFINLRETLEACAPGMCCPRRAASDFGEIQTPAHGQQTSRWAPAEPRAARKAAATGDSLGTLTPRSPLTPALWSARSLTLVFPSCSLEIGRRELEHRGPLRPPGSHTGSEDRATERPKTPGPPASVAEQRTTSKLGSDTL